MIVSAIRNSVWADMEYKNHFINVDRILSIEPYKDRAVIRLSDEISYVTEKSFDEIVNEVNFYLMPCLTIPNQQGTGLKNDVMNYYTKKEGNKDETCN